MKAKNYIRYAYTDAGENAGRGVVDVVGIFGEDENDALTFRDTVQGMVLRGCTQLVVRVNSLGGCLFTAFAMYDSLRAARAAGVAVVAEVHGVAASAASLFIMGAERILMSENSQLMLHAPSTCVWGRLDELQEQVDALRDSWQRMCAIYSERTGTPAEELSAALQKDTWYTCEQAIEAKLADGTVEPFELSQGAEAERGGLRAVAAELARRTGAWLTRKRAAQADGAPEGESDPAATIGQVMHQRIAMQAERAEELRGALATSERELAEAQAEAAAAAARADAAEERAGKAEARMREEMEAREAAISARVEQAVAERMASIGVADVPAPAEPACPRMLTDAQVQALISGARTGALLEYSATGADAFRQVNRLLKN